MSSALPDVDPSVRWPRCPACPYRHRPNTDCPRPGRWLKSGEAVAAWEKHETARPEACNQPEGRS